MGLLPGAPNLPAWAEVLPEGFQLMLADFTRGLPPAVIEWFLHSQDPKAQEHRERIRMLAAQHIEDANRRQALRHEAMKEEAKYFDEKAELRPIASIDPVIAQDMRNRYGSGCLNDREFLDDCRRKAPQLFFPK